METIIGYKKTTSNTLKAVYKKLDNSPKVRHNYINGKLWIFGIGNCYTTKKEAEKNRDKKYERPAVLHFFGRTWFANVARYNFHKIISETI